MKDNLAECDICEARCKKDQMRPLGQLTVCGPCFYKNFDSIREKFVKGFWVEGAAILFCIVGFWLLILESL